MKYLESDLRFIKELKGQLILDIDSSDPREYVKLSKGEGIEIINSLSGEDTLMNLLIMKERSINAHIASIFHEKRASKDQVKKLINEILEK